MAKPTSNLAKFTSFMSEDDAVAMLERLRWPNGAACPHCGGADPYRLTPKATTKTRTQCGLWKCSQCRKKLTVKVGTVLESSHIPVSKWLMAMHLISASKKGMSALQFQRMLGITYRAAWFMAHRLRHAMQHDGFILTGTVEVDETYIGGKRRVGRYSYEGTGGRPGPKDQTKTAVVALVQRNGNPYASAADFMKGGDPWVIAFAMASGGFVVTEELRNKYKTKVKIPNVAKALRVPWKPTHEMCRELNMSQFR